MSSPAKYRKKPVVIEAMEFRGTTQAYDVYRWIESHIGSVEAYEDKSGVTIDPADGQMVIRTLEGDMKADLGDFIIKGVNGEFYPCKPDIFAKTYEVAA